MKLVRCAPPDCDAGLVAERSACCREAGDTLLLCTHVLPACTERLRLYLPCELQCAPLTYLLYADVYPLLYLQAAGAWLPHPQRGP